MGAENFTQCPVQQVGGGVVRRNLRPPLLINLKYERVDAVLGHLLDYVYGQVVLLNRIHNPYALAVGGCEPAGVADLAAHLAVERSAVENELATLLVLGLDYPRSGQNRLFHAEAVVAEELHIIARNIFAPVAVLCVGGVAGAFLLLQKLHVELLHVYGISVFGGYEQTQVEREAVGVVERERIHSADDLRGGNNLTPGRFRARAGNATTTTNAVRAHLLHYAFNQPYAPVERPQERHFLFAYDPLDERLLGGEFGIGLAHILHKLLHETAEEGLAEAEESVAIPDRTAQNPAGDIARLHVGGQLSVGDGEADGADVVGDHPHGHVGLCVGPVFMSAELLNPPYHPSENVCVIVALLALKHHAEPLEAYARVYVLGRQDLQFSVRLAVVLDEHEVPQFNHERIALVDELTPRHGRHLGLVAQVYVNLAAGSAGARVAHLPEIVVPSARENPVLRHVFPPFVLRFGVPLRSVSRIPLKHSHIEPVLRYAIDLRQ